MPVVPRKRRLSAVAGVLTVALMASGLVGAVGPRRQAAAQSGSAPTQVVRFDGIKYSITGCPSITVTRAAPGDPPPDAAIEVASSSGDHDLLPLTQKGADTWVASTCERPGPATVNDGTLEVAPGDGLMAATFTAGAPSGMAVATVGGGPDNGTVSVTLNRQPLPPGLRRDPNPQNPAGLGPPFLTNAALTQPDGSRIFFSEDQVIFRESAPGDLPAFLARHPKSVVLNSVTLTDVTDTPGGSPKTTTYYDIYVDAAKYPTGDTAPLLEAAGATGTFSFTSQAAMSLYAILLDEQAAGTQVFPNTIALRDSTPSTNEAQSSPNRYDLFNSPNNPWFNGTNQQARQVGAPQTVALLDVMKQDQQPHTKLAIIDGGFGGPNDYGNNFTPPDYGAPSGDFNQIPQCKSNAVGLLSCAPGIASGSSITPCGGQFSKCPWHGTEMAAAAAGRINNGGPASDGGNSGGIGGQTADLMLYNVEWTYFLPLISSINDATMKGAKVINLSSGFPCMQFIDLCDSVARTLTKMAITFACAFGGAFLGIACAVVADLLDLFADVDGLHKAIDNAIASDVVVVAAAGNDGKDVGSQKDVPCIWPNVICVGNLMQGNNLDSAASSNYGARLDLWSPGTTVGVFPTPTPPKAQTSSNGTSPATAFTSGVVSITRSVAPNLSASGVRQLLADSVCRTGHTIRVDGSACTPSGNARVDANGYLDVLDALRRARAAAGLPSLGACTGGWDQLNAPNDDARTPRPIPGSPFGYTQFGPLGTWTGDATVKRSTFTPDGLPDGQWYSASFDQSTIPSGSPASLNVQMKLHVPDPSLGTLTLEVYSIVKPSDGNTLPGLKLDHPYKLVDTTAGGGTGEWDGYLLLSKLYLIHVVATTPETANNNCFDSLSLTSIRAGGSPPSREAGLEIGNASIISGRANPTSPPGAMNVAQIPVTLTQPLNYQVDVQWNTFDGTAKSPTDYAAANGTLSIPAGVTGGQILVRIAPHAKKAGGAFGVQLTSANAPIYYSNAIVAIDDPAPKGPDPVVEVAGAGTFEGDVGAEPRGLAIVQLDRPASTNTVVNYTLSSTDAEFGIDWNAFSTNGFVFIPKGQTQAVVHFSVLGDTVPEFTQHVTVTLTSVAGAATLGTRSSDDVLIFNDDDF